MQKTFGLNNEEVMWGDSWINLRMKMADLPYFSYNSEEGKEGTLDDMRNKFGKNIKK